MVESGFNLEAHYVAMEKLASEPDTAYAPSEHFVPGDTDTQAVFSSQDILKDSIVVPTVIDDVIQELADFIDSIGDTDNNDG